MLMLIFLGAFAMVFFAELGDKSQLLAVSLASRYKIRTVLMGIIVATVLNNGLAIILGVYLKASLELDLIQVAASLSFILFGIWNMLEKRGEEIENKETPSGWTPFITVALAFFLAEMGDKTQLATVAYVIKHGAPFLTFLGVLLGMVTADALGIFAGSYLLRRFPEKYIKLMSSSIFISLGVIGLWFFFTGD